MSEGRQAPTPHGPPAPRSARFTASPWGTSRSYRPRRDVLDRRAEQPACGPNLSCTLPYHLRSLAEIAGYFDGLEMVEPGLVPVSHWRLDTDTPPTSKATAP
ncbi:SAM-dependent methyltransferase [Actinomadura litoris]|uniref:SAM-dependent methyltransferase n=1 Tax=Actinomadura litoris TaxID=2678616 RepID=UPI001FA7016D|nr:SAM-dependent methyltransferase [Actinomadura litoris]